MPEMDSQYSPQPNQSQLLSRALNKSSIHCYSVAHHTEWMARQNVKQDYAKSIHCDPHRPSTLSPWFICQGMAETSTDYWTDGWEWVDKINQLPSPWLRWQQEEIIHNLFIYYHFHICEVCELGVHLGRKLKVVFSYYQASSLAKSRIFFTVSLT